MKIEVNNYYYTKSNKYIKVNKIEGLYVYFTYLDLGIKSFVKIKEAQTYWKEPILR